MKKRKHIHTNFIKFIVEKYSKPKKDEDIDKPDTEEDIDLENEEEPNKNKIKVEDEDNYEEEEDEEDEIIEKLLNEYKNIKGKYEHNRIQNKRRK